MTVQENKWQINDLISQIDHDIIVVLVVKVPSFSVITVIPLLKLIGDLSMHLFLIHSIIHSYIHSQNDLCNVRALKPQSSYIHSYIHSFIHSFI